MKILVTGGEGFIGSHLVDALASYGHEVVSLDNRSAISNSKFYNENKKVKYYEFDILNYGLLFSTFELRKFDIVFHLAAESRIQPTFDSPFRSCLTNFIGTQSLLEACKLTGVKKFIYSSSSSCYGLKNSCPLTEDMPTDCLSPYSVSKVGGEGLCKVYNSAWGVKAITLRYFNVYGERQPIKGQYAPVIGKFLKQSRAKEPMTIVGDGLQRRDFTHVKDVVKANILAANSENELVFGEIFNIGSGRSHSLLGVANLIGGEYIHTPQRLGEARETLADISKAQRLLGYQPEIRLEDWIGAQP